MKTMNVRLMKKYLQTAFVILGIVLTTGFFFSGFRVEASDLMFSGRMDSCNDCHAEILEEIGLGEHLSMPLEYGQNYANCAGCHELHPEIDGPPVSVHQFSRLGNAEFCAQCHFSGNQASASAMVLPPKSVTCAACHISDYTADDWITIISLTIFLLGIIGLTFVWFSGNIKAVSVKGIIRAIFSVRLFHALNALFLDAILQRKLFRQSRIRWFIHGLIFFPMLVRFGWGIFVAVFARVAPEHPMVFDMLDKNHPIFGSLLFELTGWLVVAGIFFAVMRKVFFSKKSVQGLPAQGRGSFYLLGSIILVGFILKGMRIAMTGFPDGSETAWISYGIASLFSGVENLTDIYGYVWYAHAALFGLFVATLPFSRMFHIIMGPVAVIIQAMKQH